MFVTLPIAFGNLPLGAVLGCVFFLLVSFAAITSAISLTEPVLTYLVERYDARRWIVAVVVGLCCWLLGIGTVLSFNEWSEAKLFGLTFFEAVDYLSYKIMLPLGGLLIALFAGWVLAKRIVVEQLGFGEGTKWQLWNAAICVIAPAGILIVFAYSLYETFAS